VWSPNGSARSHEECVGECVTFFVVVEFLEWNVELCSTRTLTFFLGGSTVGNYGLV